MPTLDELLAGDTPPGTPVTLVLTEQELTEIANSQLGQTGGLSVSDASVKLAPNMATVTARARFGNLPLQIEVVGSPEVSDGAVRVNVERLTLNGAPAPAFVTTQVMAALNQRLDPANLPLAFESIEVGSGQVKVVGTTK